MYLIHTENLKIKYFSNFFSLAFLINLVLIFIKLFLPYLVIYCSGSLWQKIDIHQEQPDIKFKNEILILMEIENETQSITYFWSNLPILNSIDSSFIKIPSINNIELDYNNDNVNEELKLNLDLKLSNSSKVKTIQCLLLFDFKIKKYAKFDMESIVKLNINTNLYNFLVYKGSIVFNQNKIIDANGNTIIKNILDYNKISDNLENFMTLNSKKDFFLSIKDLNSEYILIEDDNNFKLNLIIDYPEITFKIKPKFWPIIKFAWIQYLSIFIILNYIIKRIKKIIYEEQLVISEINLSDHFLSIQQQFIPNKFI